MKKHYVWVRIWTTKFPNTHLFIKQIIRTLGLMLIMQKEAAKINYIQTCIYAYIQKLSE